MSGSSTLSTLLLLAVAVVLAGSLWMLRWDTTMQKAYPDTFWYTRQAATMAGFPTDQAEEIAARTSCKHGQPMVEGWPNCDDGIRGYAAALPERYNRIPETRPGYPLVAAPFVAAFHEQGMVVATALLGGLSGMLVALVGNRR